MKKQFLAIISGVLTTLTAFGQEFEGKISYNISYEIHDDEMGMATMMMPKSEQFYQHDGTAKMIQEISLGKYTIVKNLTKDTTQVFLDIMGQKIQLLMGKLQLDNQFSPYKATNIKYVSGKKMIGDKVCKRAMVTFNDSLPEVEVYYLPNYTCNAYPMFGDLNGIPVSYTMKNKSFTVTKTASVIDPKPLKPEDISVPEGYEPKTINELMGTFQTFSFD